MDQYKDYLAANVLQESRPITYRLLSRALKVNVHQAKQMLFDFHATENKKKPSSVHATYIITGTKLPQPATHTNGANLHSYNDVHMRSSPIPSSLPDAPEDDDERAIKVTSIKLVREEDLGETKAHFEEITSIHIYSLEPGPLKDLQVLSDCSREAIEKCCNEDPLEAWKTYGSIYNPHTRRRTPGIKPQAAVPVATTAAAKTAPRPSTTAMSKQKEAQDTSKAKDFRPSTPQVDPSALPNKKTDKKAQPSLKKEGSSIFSAFARTQSKNKTAGSGTSTPAAKSAEHSQAEDETMKDASDEEGEDDDVAITSSNKKSKEEASEAMKKARAEREAKEKKLREMMEEDDDDDDTPMQDAPAAAPEELEEPAIDHPAEPEPALEKQEATVEVSGGRRRGKRRVMKKRTYQDAEGYFVTKEEPVWEFFSEDEPEPKKLKPAPTTTAKPKKGGGKQGQGNIMSFFAKKPS
ncbi:hypothetical protein SLS56_005405 [Neofusicoccum ribis]|uniref:DNA polymerase delta subunit 3 n=1 Tax=Neofusicoccum ribis TaxID=45134 RepID=A0ABR3SUK8_9PEZI